jgi:hypothetical protein
MKLINTTTLKLLISTHQKSHKGSEKNPTKCTKNSLRKELFLKYTKTSFFSHDKVKIPNRKISKKVIKCALQKRKYNGK